MLKLLFLYFSSLGLTWVSLCSIMFGISHWGFSGAFMPVVIGLLILLIAIRLLLATIRIYLPPKNRRIKGVVNYPEGI